MQSREVKLSALIIPNKSKEIKENKERGASPLFTFQKKKNQINWAWFKIAVSIL
jgi:hypothetical protein